MLTETEIQEIKNYRMNGNSYEKIAKKMNKSKSTIIKYCKEESQEESKNEVLEVQIPEKEKPLAYYQEFEFIEAIKNCEAIVEHITHKEFGLYNHKAKIFQSQFKYTLEMLQNGDKEGFDALTQLYIRYQNFDDKCDVIADLKGDIIRLRKESDKEREENEVHKHIYHGELMMRQKELHMYDDGIEKKQTEIRKLQVRVELLQNKEITAQRAVDHLYIEGNEIIDRTKGRYKISLRFGQMRETIPYLQKRFNTEIEKLENINDYHQLIANLSLLKKPLENLVDVISVLPSDLFKKMCVAVEGRKVKEFGLIRSNQPFTHDGMYQMMMTEMAKAMNGGDELNEIIKLKKLKEMTKS